MLPYSLYFLLIQPLPKTFGKMGQRSFLVWQFLNFTPSHNLLQWLDSSVAAIQADMYSVCICYTKGLF